MPTSRTLAEHLAAISDNAAALVAEAAGVSMADPVPSCPRWTVEDLLGHAGGVLHWAAVIVGEGRTANLSAVELDTVMAAPKSARQLLDWCRAGAAQLVAALADARNEPGFVFLPDAPAPRLFWARRLASETAIHRVDMLSAALGHLPTAAATGISAELAIDGIDELILGFVPRDTSTLRSPEPVVTTVVPTDSRSAWTVRISSGIPGCAPGAVAEPDATLSGSAVGLYLGLWNRGDEIAEHGRAPVLGLWREKVRVRWS